MFWSVIAGVVFGPVGRLTSASNFCGSEFGPPIWLKNSTVVPVAENAGSVDVTVTGGNSPVCRRMQPETLTLIVSAETGSDFTLKLIVFVDLLPTLSTRF